MRLLTSGKLPLHFIAIFILLLVFFERVHSGGHYIVYAKDAGSSEEAPVYPLSYSKGNNYKPASGYDKSYDKNNYAAAPNYVQSYVATNYGGNYKYYNHHNSYEKHHDGYKHSHEHHHSSSSSSSESDEKSYSGNYHSGEYHHSNSKESGYGGGGEGRYFKPEEFAKTPYNGPAFPQHLLPQVNLLPANPFQANYRPPQVYVQQMPSIYGGYPTVIPPTLPTTLAPLTTPKFSTSTRSISSTRRTSNSTGTSRRPTTIISTSTRTTKTSPSITTQKRTVSPTPITAQLTSESQDLHSTTTRRLSTTPRIPTTSTKKPSSTPSTETVRPSTSKSTFSATPTSTLTTVKPTVNVTTTISSSTVFPSTKTTATSSNGTTINTTQSSTQNTAVSGGLNTENTTISSSVTNTTTAAGTTVIPSSTSKPKCPPGWEYFPEIDCCIKLSPVGEQTTWAEAETNAESQGAHLASVTNKEENDFIEGLVVNRTKEDPNSPKRFWIGLQVNGSSNGNAQNSSWSDGSPMFFGSPIQANTLPYGPNVSMPAPNAFGAITVGDDGNPSWALFDGNTPSSYVMKLNLGGGNTRKSVAASSEAGKNTTMQCVTDCNESDLKLSAANGLNPPTFEQNDTLSTATCKIKVLRCETPSPKAIIAFPGFGNVTSKNDPLTLVRAKISCFKQEDNGKVGWFRMGNDEKSNFGNFITEAQCVQK